MRTSKSVCKTTNFYKEVSEEFDFFKINFILKMVFLH